MSLRILGAFFAIILLTGCNPDAANSVTPR